MLKAVVLLFSIIVSINCGTMWKRSTEIQTMNEIINTLATITNGQLNTDECRSALVLDIFTPMADQNAPETFCKAAIALQRSTGCSPIEHSLNSLRTNLQNIDIKASNCTMNINSQVSLSEFLQTLLRFSRSSLRERNYYKH